MTDKVDISTTEALKKLVFSNGAKWLGAILLAATTGTSGVFYGQKATPPSDEKLILKLPEGVDNATFHQIAPDTYIIVPIYRFWVGTNKGQDWAFEEVKPNEIKVESE